MKSRRKLIDPEDSGLPVAKQCELLGVPRSSYYYRAVPESDENLYYMRLIDQIYLDFPHYGRRSMTGHLRGMGKSISTKRVARLMNRMGLKAIYPKSKKKAWQKKYGVYPYLLKGLQIHPQNHVWATDITYIPVRGGYIYLVAVMDVYSRFILSWNISDSLESDFCIAAVEKAFDFGRPKILNSDQGVQFTSKDYITLLRESDIEISMSGKGRCYDNIFIERFWRSLKYEEVYLHNYEDPAEAIDSIGEYMNLYNSERVHSSLNYRTPGDVYLAA